MGKVVLGGLCLLASFSTVSPLRGQTLSSYVNEATVPSPHVERQEETKRKMERFAGQHWDIVFDGDSITNRWETTGKSTWQTHYASRAADFGIEGDRVEHVLWRLRHGQLDGVDPKVVVLMIGTNNSGRNTADEIADGIKAVVKLYEKSCPHAHIVLMGIFPRGKSPSDGGRVKVEAVNRQIKSLAKDSRVSFVDIGSQLLEPDQTISPEMMPDYVHPTAKGYEIWADNIDPVIDSYLPSVQP